MVAHDLADRRPIDSAAPTAGRPASDATSPSGGASLRASLKSLPYSRQLEALSPRGERRHAKSPPRPSRTPEPRVSQNPTPENRPQPDGATPPQADVATPELLSFVAGPHAIANYQPSTGYGLFDAEYDGARQELVVTVRCAFRFTAGNSEDFPAADPGALTWDDDSKSEWRKGFIDLIGARWSGTHAFRCTGAGLESLRAAVRVQVVEADRDWHFRLDVKRIPKGQWTGSSVTTHPGSKLETNHADLDSEDMTPTPKGGSEGQLGAVHEFGHMIGLGDEYGSGTKIAHRALVKDALGTEISKGTSDDVMSCANRVGKQHDVTFLEALKKATGVDEWIFAE